METWMKQYEIQLRLAIQNNPKDYRYGEDQVPAVLARMREGFQNRTYNKDGEAIKNTCKFFKIAHTYKAINHFIVNHG